MSCNNIDIYPLLKECCEADKQLKGPTGPKGTSGRNGQNGANGARGPTGALGLNPTNIDAFGRIRVSNPYTIFDTKTRYYNHDQFDSSLTAGGLVTYDIDASSFELAVTTTSDAVLRETKKVFAYQPGKSLLILNTFSMSGNSSLTQRVGFYGAENGIYFERDGTTLNMVLRSSSYGSLTENRVAQSAWNGDPLDGTGASGHVLDPSLVQIYWIDIEWLGVGTVKTGFIINGEFIICHSFNHANVSGNTTTYMTTAILPIRYEIESTGGSGTMTQICSTVISEGGFNQTNVTESAGGGTTTFPLSSGGTYYPLVSIRLASTRLDAIVAPRQVNLLSPTVNYYRWVLLLNPTFSGTVPAWTASSTGTVEYILYDTNFDIATQGTELQSGYISSRELSVLESDFFDVQLGRTLSGTSDIITLAVSCINNNANILAQLGWQELS